ncbi:MAG: DUF6090 family protein [Pseudomonadota bacterium]
MLLRRLTGHVKAQNWTAVGLDFFIVVIGVFIGIQVANWNDTRAEDRREKVLLQRLHSDFERIVSWGDEFVPLTRALPSNTSYLIERIRADIEPQTDDEKFLQGLAASVTLIGPFEISPTYEELVSTGTLSRITNTDLRDALSSYGRFRETEFIVTEKLYAVQNTGVMREAVQFRTHEEDPLETAIPVTFDWEALKDTEPHLQVVLQNQLFSIDWKQGTLNSAREVLTLLEAELGLAD